MKLVDIGVPYLWGYFKDGVLRACDEMCGKKKGMGKEGYEKQRRYMVMK